MMSDLPHHPASEPEWAGLMSATSHLLHAVFSTSRPPSLVTIARLVIIHMPTCNTVEFVVFSHHVCEYFRQA